jgi:hypothetical protein
LRRSKSHQRAKLLTVGGRIGEVAVDSFALFGLERIWIAVISEQQIGLEGVLNQRIRQ